MEKLNNSNVLIIDDDPKDIRIVTRILSADYAVKSTPNADKVFEILSHWQPAVILLDIVMPGMNGLDLCRKIKSDKRNNLIKIILVSGRVLAEDRLEGYAVGADDYLTKPFVHEELAAKVKVFANLYNAEFNLKSLNANLEQEVLLKTQEVIKSEKMAAIGMQAAEIVHDLMNPLSGIKGCAEILKREYPDNRMVSLLINASDNLKEVILGILEETRKISRVREQNLAEILSEEAEKLCGEVYSSLEITVTSKFKDSVTLTGVEAHFRQVFANLLKNAIDAMVDIPEKELRLGSYREGDFHVISISDNGSGISQDNMGKIFSPLFSTKSNSTDEVTGSSGSGLGLSSCKRMVEAYHGSIEVQSEKGKGTTFFIKFPV